VGAHQQLNPVANAPEPYGEVSVTYNLGSRAIDKHLDRSVDAYAGWKKVQENDVERGMEVLRDQVEQTITVQQNRINSLRQETEEIEKNLKLVSDADTSAALDFRNQLISTELLLGIETGDASYRLDRLQDFVRKNL
jgi:wobble nucleotide-excising tRNase